MHTATRLQPRRQRQQITFDSKHSLELDAVIAALEAERDPRKHYRLQLQKRFLERRIAQNSAVQR